MIKSSQCKLLQANERHLHVQLYMYVVHIENPFSQNDLFANKKPC